MLVLGNDGQSDRPDQDVVCEEHDRKVDERTGVEFLLLARDPLLGGAIGIGMGEEGAGCDLFHSGQPLHLWCIARLKLPEAEPIGFEGRDSGHGRDETTDRAGLTITSGSSLSSPSRRRPRRSPRM